MLRSGAAVAIGMVAALQSGCVIDVHGDEFVVRDEKRFTVTGTPELTLETFDGAIRVRSWDRNEVRVEIEKRAEYREEAEKLDVRTTQDGNRIRIEAPRAFEYEGFRFGFRRFPVVSLIVTAPRRLSLEARTGDGAISAEGLTGSIDLATGDGSVRGRDLDGEIAVHTGDGAITLMNAGGSVMLETGDGSISVSGRLEKVQVRTGDGSVRVTAARGSVAKDDWDIATGDGSIVLAVPPAFNAEVEAHSGDGRVRATDVTVIERSEEGGTLRGRLGSGGALVRLSSGDGSIRISHQRRRAADEDESAPEPAEAPESLPAEDPSQR